MSESVTPSPHGSGEVSEVRSHNVIGGTIVAVLGLALLGFSFYMPNTTMVPRILAVLIVLAGIGTAMGVIPVQGPRDFYGGLVLVMAADLGLDRFGRVAWAARLCLWSRDCPETFLTDTCGTRRHWWPLAACLPKDRRSRNTRSAVRCWSLSASLPLPP